MLNGVDPVIIFQFSKLAPSVGGVLNKIPIVSEFKTLIEMPPIPIYLSENLTGLFVDNEDKMVDFQTDTDTLTDGETPDVNQKGVSNVVSINLSAKKDSIGIALLSALIDQVFDKASSKEYKISYLHGATTIFGGLLHSYQVSQNASNDLLSIKIELTKGDKKPTATANNPVVSAARGVTPL